MRKFLLYSSALVMLSGTAEAACIQTPSCSSLGYESTSSCSGGLKCPFGNAWNCTGPNNTTEINKLKTEISGIKTDISNIKTNITNLTNRITNIENNSGSGSDSGLLCAECEVGDYVCGGKCYSYQVAMPDGELNPECTDFVIEKKVEVGKNTCRKAPTKYSKNPVITLTYDEAMKYADIKETSYRTTITLTQVSDDTGLVCEYISSNRFGYNNNAPGEQIIWSSFGINIEGFDIFRNKGEMACNPEYNHPMYSDPYKEIERYARSGRLKMLNITTFN